MARRSGDQLVLADARRSIASSHGGYGAGISRRPLAMRPLSPSSLRALEPRRLLRAGGLLYTLGPQELRPATAVLCLGDSDYRRTESAHGKSSRTEVPRRRICIVHIRRRPASCTSRLDVAAR